MASTRRSSASASAPPARHVNRPPLTGGQAEESILRALAQPSAGVARHGRPIGLQRLGVALAIAVGREDLVLDPSNQGRGAQGKDAFDAPDEISRHPVGAAHQENRLGPVIDETEDAAVLEETAEEAPHPDVLALPGYSRMRQQMPRTMRSTFTPACEAA